MYKYTQRDIERNLESRHVERGMEYVAQGRVQSLYIEQPNAIKAQVEGSLSTPYDVSVQVMVGATGINFYGRCSCPVGINCKHVAATLLVNLSLAEKNGKGESSKALRPSQSRPTAAKGKDSEATGELNLWLQRAKGEAPKGAIPDAHAPENSQRLVYLVSFDEITKRASVRIVLARVLQSGEYGTASPWNNAEGAVRNPPHFAVASDLRALRRLLLDSTRAYLGNFILSGVQGRETLISMIDTGRCHWATPHGRSLQVSEARVASMHWKVGKEGAQHLEISTTPTSEALLAFTPPWYVDSKTGECGPVDLGVPGDVGELLVTTPVIPPSQVPAVRAVLASYAQTNPIPLPTILSSEDTKAAKITPCLRFESVVTFNGQRTRYMPLGMALDVAILQFDYDGLLVTRDSPGALSTYRDGRLIRMQRDAKVEKAAHTRMSECGFAKLSGLPLQYPAKYKHDYSMYSADDWVEFMVEALPTLLAEGWRAEFEPDFRYRVARVSEWTARIETTGTDWFDLHLDAEVDGKREDLLPIVLAALRDSPDTVAYLREEGAKKGVVLNLDDGRLFTVATERLQAILSVLHELLDAPASDGTRLRRLDAVRLAHLDQAMPLQWRGGDELRALGKRLASFDAITPVAGPSEFGANLRGYQGEGLSWLQFLRDYGLNGILADDMGLGKTVQALAHILKEKQAGRLDCPVLVVSPTSVLPNWRAETLRFAPQLRVHVSHGLERKANFDRIAQADVVLTTYPLLARDKDVLHKQQFHLVILDEAQLIKNAQTQAAKIVGELRARHRLCMTGTPLENHLGELWSLFHFLMPGFLGDSQSFRRMYRTPIEKHDDELRRENLIRRIRPFILRRTKEQVAAELPPKSEILRMVEFSGAQKDLYETVRVSMHERVRAEIQARGLANSHIIVLDALLKLRQICCDPRLLKLEAAGKVKESAKLDTLMDMLPELIAEGRRVLLFSQFTSMLALIEAQLKEKQIKYVKLTGDTKNREQPVKAFQRGDVDLFLISLKAGGTGLNLTAADTVIHYDPWWNPAVENQATDRAHRIGQDKPVFVYKLIVAGSVEEKITALQQCKAELAASLLDGARKGGAPLSAEDIAALFEPMN